MQLKNTFLVVALIGLGAIIGGLTSLGSVTAQVAPSVQSGDALWHLPQFGDRGWFLHASNGKVRACNMAKTSVVGEKPGPRCSNWE